MARALKPTSLTPTDELRSLLDALERRLATAHMTPTDVTTMLAEMDGVAELTPSLQAAGVDLRAEMGRWDAIAANTRRRAGKIARAAGTALAAARQEAGATPDRWWWYVDAIARQQVWQQVRRLATIGVAIALVAVAVVVIFDRLFPVDPAVQRAQGYAFDAESALVNGDHEAALAAFRQAADTLPTDAPYRIWVGMLAERLGRAEEADAAYAQARTLVTDEAQFHVLRGQNYLQMAEPQAALDDAQAALALDAETAEAHFIAASALEALGRTEEAIAAYEQASSLAGAQGNDTLVVLARVRLGTLLQGSLGGPGEPVTVTPSPAP